jgi:hypothetical protein
VQRYRVAMPTVKILLILNYIIMKIKEKDLINLGFERINVSEQESGANSFYYYTLDFGENKVVSLISSSNDEVVDDNWDLLIFEDDSLVIKKLEDLISFITIMKKINSKEK